MQNDKDPKGSLVGCGVHLCDPLPSIRSYADKTLDLAGWCVTTVCPPAAHQGLGVEHRGQGEDRRGEHERQPRKHLEPVR
jgi:hypothetical protein